MKHFVFLLLPLYLCCCSKKSESYIVGTWIVEKLIVDSMEYQNEMMSNAIVFSNDNLFSCFETAHDTNTTGRFLLNEKDSLLTITTKNIFFSDSLRISIKSFDAVNCINYIELKSEKRYLLLSKLPPRCL